MSRIAIIEKDKCQPTSCGNYLCARMCPVNRTGKECIIESEDKKAQINEELCTGCGICPKICPFNAIQIINLPEKLKSDPIHRFGINQFELFTLPTIKENTVVGLLGRNGIGKSTALAILSGVLTPNLGNYDKEVKKEEITKRYDKTIMHDYFKKLFKTELKLSYKPQRVELLPQIYKGKVKELISKVDEKGIGDKLLRELDLEHKKESNIKDLSGGELQRLAIIAAAIKKSDVYYFDEPASFCDIIQRIKVAKVIKELAKNASVVVVEHDLATLDYISDEIQIVYGQPSGYGVISQSKSVRRGINEYLDGYIPDDNVRFRDYSIKFSKRAESKTIQKEVLYKFYNLEKSFEDFNIKINPGEIKKGEVLCIMGANGLGKSTFLRILAGKIEPDKGKVEKIAFSYKPQYLGAKNKTVEEYLKQEAGNEYNSGWYKTNILEKLNIQNILTNNMETLSGGELQKVLIAGTLSSDAKLLILDEPSAFIDVEDRLRVAEVIKEFVSRKGICAMVVDHDVQFIDYLADSIIVFEGKPGIQGVVHEICSREEGMNKVLKILDITYRLDNQTKRPRINKPGSQLDVQQRKKGQFYYS